MHEQHQRKTEYTSYSPPPTSKKQFSSPSWPSPLPHNMVLSSAGSSFLKNIEYNLSWQIECVHPFLQYMVSTPMQIGAEVSVTKAQSHLLSQRKQPLRILRSQSHAPMHPQKRATLGSSRQDIDWTAHTFLCVVGKCLLERKVFPLAAFEWEFEIVNPTKEDEGESGGREEIRIKELKGVDVGTA